MAGERRARDLFDEPGVLLREASLDLVEDALLVIREGHFGPCLVWSMGLDLPIHYRKPDRSGKRRSGAVRFPPMGENRPEFEPMGESDFPQAGIVIGSIGAILGSLVWVYLGFLTVVHREETSRIAYKIKVLGALGLLATLPGAVAVVVGVLGLLHRRASRPFRRRSLLALALGVGVIGGAAAIQLMANAAVRR